MAYIWPFPKQNPLEKGKDRGCSAGWASVCGTVGAQQSNMKYLIAQNGTQAECVWLGWFF